MAYLSLAFAADEPKCIAVHTFDTVAFHLRRRTGWNSFGISALLIYYGYCSTLVCLYDKLQSSGFQMNLGNVLRTSSQPYLQKLFGNRFKLLVTVLVLREFSLTTPVQCYYFPK